MNNNIGFFQKTVRGTIRFAVTLTLAILLMRIVEFFLLLPETLNTYELFSWMLQGVGYDGLLLFRWLFVIAAVYALCLFWLGERVEKLFRFLLILGALMALGRVSYYVTAAIPLDQVLFTYSLQEIWQTLSASTTQPVWSYLMFLLIPALLWYGHRKMRCFTLSDTIAGVLFIISCLLFVVLPMQPQKGNIQSEAQYNTVVNKLAYFIGGAYEYFTTSEKQINIEELPLQIAEFQKDYPEFQFVDQRYPMVHELDSLDSPLAPLFALNKNKAPNLVFIVCESLSRSLSGPEPEYFSTTPFLDSLAQHSLYWQNCLSTSQRTFGVLPSVFGVLPFGKRGFLDYGKRTPEHQTLIEVLHQVGYHSSFYYGGWLQFDKMADFMDNEKVTHFITDWSGSEKQVHKETGFSWGYDDRETFKQGILATDFDKEPRLDIFLTLSSHEPWVYPQQEKYVQKFKTLLEPSSIDSEKSEYMLMVSEKISAFTFLDDAIRELIESYKGKPGYENTIFIITGDHRFSFKPQKPIDKYHVPLMIFSPMLNKVERYQPVVSHRNIAPSVLSLLASNGFISSPKNISWFSSTLDTVSYFRSKGFSPFMLTNRKIDEYLYRDFFITPERVYKINESLCLTQIEEKEVIDSITAVAARYRFIDRYVCDYDALLPSLFDNRNVIQRTIKQFHDDFDFNQGDYRKNNHEIISGDDGRGKVMKIKQNSVYPLSLGKAKLKSTWDAIMVKYQFDIFLDEESKPRELGLILEIKGDDKARMWDRWGIGDEWYEEYGKWRTFSDSLIIKRKNYNYQDDDIINFYFWNNKQVGFELDNIKIEFKELIYK